MKRTEIFFVKAKTLICTAILALGLVSCYDDFEFRQTEWNETYDADEVTMTGALSVAPMELVAPESRAITYVAAEPEEKIITDVWIIEYNEEGNRVGLPRYYELEKSNVTKDGETEPIVIEDFKLLVPREPDHEYTCVVIANTHNDQCFHSGNRSKFSTLDSLRVCDIEVHNQEDLFDPHPDDKHPKRYLHMSGWTKINKDTKNFEVDLIRNTCKVNVKLSSFCDELIIKYVQWVNMPQGKLFPHGTADHYVEPVSRDWRMHNEESYYEALMDEGLTFWVPCNVWLPEEGLMDKPRQAPMAASSTYDNDIEEDPTHFDIVCRRDDDEDMNLYEFRIYPSRDANTQCRFEPNHYYHIDVKINGMPNDENDFFRKTKFNNLGNSNSFMLEQDTKGTYVIDLDRPNTFWKQFDEGNMIEEDTDWVAEVIWQDTDLRVVDFAIYSIGEVTQDRSRFYGQGNTCIPFRTTGTGLGNVIIGVRMKYGDEDAEMSKEDLDRLYPVESREYLWSWHLWITDYQPDRINDPSSTTVKYDAFYQVPGGQVIQMGINKMMDRNLGAWAPEVKDPSNPEDILKTFGLYYQYGRKDPFPYFNPERRPIYDIAGNLIPAFNEQQVTFEVTTRVPILDEDGRDVKNDEGNSTYDYQCEIRTEPITMRASEGGSFAYGVLRPYMFWTDPWFTRHWATDAGDASASDVTVVDGWYLTDWYQGIMQELQELGNYDMKDIFDPCPAGWVMDSSVGDFYEGGSGSVGAAIELFYGQQEYLLWKGTINADEDSDLSVKFEDTEENRAKIDKYFELEKEFWEDLNDKKVSISGAPSAFMGSYLYYAQKPGSSYFPAAGSRNRFGGGDRFHNYMCLPWGNNMIRFTSFGFGLLPMGSTERDEFDENEFSTATAMQVRCVRI